MRDVDAHVTALEFADGGRRIVTAADGENVRFLDAETLEPLAARGPLAERILSVAVLGDGERFAVSEEPGRVKFFDAPCAAAAGADAASRPRYAEVPRAEAAATRRRLTRQRRATGRPRGSASRANCAHSPVPAARAGEARPKTTATPRGSTAAGRAMKGG